MPTHDAMQRAMLGAGAQQQPYRPVSPVDGDVVSPQTLLRRRSKEQYNEFKRSAISQDGSERSISYRRSRGESMENLPGIHDALSKVMAAVSDQEAQAQRMSLLEPHVRPLLSRVGICPWKGKLVVGTSSQCRRDVLIALQGSGSWRVCACLSPSIDEKAVGARTEENPDMPHRRQAEGISPEELERLGALPQAIAIAKAVNIGKIISACGLPDDNTSSGSDSHRGRDDTQECVYFTADQVIDYHGSVREKPSTADEAREFLRSYSNDSVSVINSLVLTHYPSMLRVTHLDSATVYWQRIPEALVAQTVAKGEVMHAAGGFTIEDPLLYKLVDRIDGGIDSVLGLSVTALHRCMSELCAKVARLEETDAKGGDDGAKGGDDGLGLYHASHKGSGGSATTTRESVDDVGSGNMAEAKSSRK